MNFSAILDISSFFIGMIINLLLIALICYYFKRKYENLEIAQNEQAKVLYQLLQQNTSPKVMNINDILKDKVYEKLNDTESDSDSNSDSDSDSDSDLDELVLDGSNVSVKTISLDTKIHIDDINDINEINEIEEIKVQKINDINEIEEIKVQKIENTGSNLKDNDALMDELEDKDEKDYSKMSIKQLKEILSVKGINPTKMKKNEMIELIEKSSVTIDEPNQNE